MYRRASCSWKAVSPVYTPILERRQTLFPAALPCYLLFHLQPIPSPAFTGGLLENLLLRIFHSFRACDICWRRQNLKDPMRGALACLCLHWPFTLQEKSESLSAASEIFSLWMNTCHLYMLLVPKEGKMMSFFQRKRSSWKQ